MSEAIQRGRKPLNPGNRSSFLFAPPREIASQIEEYVRECNLPANQILTRLVTYALDHAELQSKTVKALHFVD